MPGAYKGYSVSGVTLMDAKVLTVNYYDDYSFMGKNGFPSSTDSDYRYGQPSGYEAQRADRTQSLLTGTFISTLTFTAQPDSLNLYIPSVMYYDRRGRQIQSKNGNHLAGGVEQEFVEYDFVGKPLKKTHIHTATGKATQTEEYTYTYDHAGRPMLTKHRLNGGKTIVLADKVYDTLGRLWDICRHGNCNQLESWYDYNVRSQLKAIHGPLFKQKLYYNDLRYDGTNQVCYNGNISAMDWEVLSDSIERGYDFTYDGLSCLERADYLQYGMRSPNHFDTSYSYDKQGNIVYLQRYGQTGEDNYGLIDDLQMKYQGNQLTSVKDTASLSACNNGFEFKDGSTADEEYLYDANGNLIQDLNKKIADIEYNFLNLPRRIKFENGNSISYLYDANGRKLRTTHVIGNDTTVTDYCGNVIYETGVAKTLLVEGGYVSLIDNKYHYFIQDHQGNNRVVADQDGNIEEVNDYYPFGGTFAGSSSVQPYKYNGKELDRKGGLEWYDYGARHYDAALGRWNVMDPMAEKYYGISPYVYCLNSPFRLIDTNGMWPGDPLLQPFGRYQYGSNVALNSFKFIHNTVASVVNTPINIINQLADETQYIYNNGVGSYLSSGTKNLGNVISSELSYRVNTSISQQAADTWQAMKDPQNWENAIATAALMLSPMKGSRVESIGQSATREGMKSMSKSLLDPKDVLRIENAATKIGKPIHVVGSRASGKATAYSDWDYIIEGLTNKNWKSIKNSLPGSKSIMDNVPRNIDIIKEPLDPTKPYIRINPK